MKVKGKNFRLLLDGAAVPAETNCSISMSGNSESVSTKDDGMWDTQEVVSTAWQASVDNYQSGHAQFVAILLMFAAAEEIPVGWDQTAGDENQTAQDASFAREGNALLNDFTFNFNDRATISTSLQFQGTGALS